MRYVLFLLPVLLAGCAVDGIRERQAQLAPLIGQSETTLIQRLGVPSRTYETGGSKFLAYTQNSIEYDPGSGPFFDGFGGYGFGGFGGGFYGPGVYGPFGYGGYGGFPPEIYQDHCETTFQVTGGMVRSFSVRGNACGYS